MSNYRVYKETPYGKSYCHGLGFAAGVTGAVYTHKDALAVARKYDCQIESTEDSLTDLSDLANNGSRGAAYRTATTIR